MIMQRAQFEQWAQRNGYLIEKLQDNHATYEFSSTLNAYHGWQAATEQSQKEIAELQAREKVLVELLGECVDTVRNEYNEMLELYKRAIKRHRASPSQCER